MIVAGIDCSINGTGVYKFTLDSNMNVIDKDYLGFTKTIKEGKNNILCYKKIIFRNYLEKNSWMYDKIFNFIADAEYVAIEDYAFGAKGRVFDIAEFTGCLKLKIVDRGIPLRLYSIGTIKMYATTKGDADKVAMQTAFLKEPNIPDLSFLPDASKKSPRQDIHDAYFITKLLTLELSLRNGTKLMNQLPADEIKIFNKVSKSSPINILAQDFLTK